MSETIDRVARAICNSLEADNYDELADGVVKAAYRQQAEAAIEATPLEQYEDALHSVRSWIDAYPLAIFPEPDFRRAAELLKAGGMTLDAVSASNMRHVLTGVRAILDAALATSLNKEEGAET